MSYKPDGFCRNENCACQSPGGVCAKFVPYLSAYCCRCGWERYNHRRKPLIHKGRKP